jgi:glycerol-3-phosphate acyltransferase PlsY
VLAIIIFITHRANLQRLAAGTEPRIGAGKKPA